jgi:hypothetical protein
MKVGGNTKLTETSAVKVDEYRQTLFSTATAAALLLLSWCIDT